MQIIGLMGAERAGKSTVAQALKERGFVTMGFAAALKRMLEAGFGLTYEQLHGSEKEMGAEQLCGRSPRFAMRTLGTEWGRVGMHDDLWVRRFEQEMLDLERTSPGGRYMVEDVRFDNEADAIRRLGGEIWLVRRPEVEPGMTWSHRLQRLLRLLPPVHPSSTGWATIKNPDRVLWNGSDRPSFLIEVEKTVGLWEDDNVVPGSMGLTFENLYPRIERALPQAVPSLPAAPEAASMPAAEPAAPASAFDYVIPFPRAEPAAAPVAAPEPAPVPEAAVPAAVLEATPTPEAAPSIPAVQAPRGALEPTSERAASVPHATTISARKRKRSGRA